MAILRQFISAFIAIALVGCYEDFTPKIDVTPVLCVNSMITAGEPVAVEVTKSFLFTDENEPHDVDDAVITIFANGERVGDDYIPQEGDIVRIEAVSSTYGEAWGEVRVPRAVPVKSVSFTPTVTDSSVSENGEMIGYISFNLDVELNFRDAPDIENYYKFDYATITPRPEANVEVGEDGEIIWMEYPNVWFSVGSLDSEREPIFGEHIGAFDEVMGGDSYGFTFFTDRQFSGKDYTLHLVFTSCRYDVYSQKWQPGLLDCEMTLILSTISDSYYNWANYRWQSEQGVVGGLGEFGLADPIWGYSNVSTGAGIIAAGSSCNYKLSLNEFLGGLFQH
ncbi:MAG: DUF4249 domain-containing protein [Muribaculaceae bacterium]|nr:DUF4249 domain-containing protein [Muribaculaceae bacterium]